MIDLPRFLFTTCQLGAERALKAEISREWPHFHFAFSRPGFLTFKLPETHRLADDFDLRSVFARTYGFTLGKVTGSSFEALAQSVWQLWPGPMPRHLHVWQRDTNKPDERTFDPSIPPPTIEAERYLREYCPQPESLARTTTPVRPARRGELILDCIMVEPEQWWIGLHRTRSMPSRWPGGITPLELPENAVSKAWLKMEESLRWSRMPISAGTRCVEIGSAPGGSSQALLRRGVFLTGIDPASMDPRVLDHPHFTHVQRRVSQVRRREFRKVRWLTADMNVAPNYTLDAVEAVVTHPEVHIRGLLLTLKLLEWNLAEHIPEYIDRIRGWGYNIVRARQLQHNRQEICIKGLKKPFRHTTRSKKIATESHNGIDG